MLISTTQTCLSDKMSPQKVKLKKLISNFARSDFLLLFLLVTFLVGILSQRYVRIFEISIKFSIFSIPNMTHFEEKQFYTSEGQFLKFFHTRNNKKDRNVTK
jgi:hypothetical protein